MAPDEEKELLCLRGSLRNVEIELAKQTVLLKELAPLIRQHHGAIYGNGGEGLRSELSQLKARIDTTADEIERNRRLFYGAIIVLLMNMGVVVFGTFWGNLF